MPDQLVNEIRATLAAARSQFEYLTDLGFVEQKVAVHAGPDVQNAEAMIPGSEALDAIFKELDDCQRCGLGASRTKLVYGVGNPNARLVLVGEAPGREEDLQGEPFVGEAGQLLDRILQAMGLHRDDVYLCNVLKCRPPNNRDPQPDEVATCEAFLARQLAAIRPQVIIGLGSFAVHSLLKTNAPISKLRGEWQSYQGIHLMPTYHPAYLLSNPEAKRDVWDDMKQVLRRLQTDGEGL
ncbi:uracil-DNA glycosylase [Deltaproteobacteria bacterium IMCC39524]|nr:uracil-DNA glycosylase [Deltaproteobacteria bacterium IMCC39524]